MNKRRMVLVIGGIIISLISQSFMQGVLLVGVLVVMFKLFDKRKEKIQE